MNVSRRPATRRLVALLVVVVLLGAASAFAQTNQKARVRLGPANIYERPRTSSDIFMVAPEGTMLDVLGREGSWYWVLMPPDGNGMRRAGYIAVYLVELINPKGPDAAPRVIAPPSRIPGLTSGVRAESKTQAPERLARYFIGIGGGGQNGAHAFADTVSFPIYDEPAQFSSAYVTPRSSALDATLGFRISPRFIFAVSFWHSTPLPVATIDAVIPHPFAYNILRPASATGFGLARAENDGHVQLTWLVPLSPRVDLSVFAGPSLFHVQQDLVSSLRLREAYPYDTVSIADVDRVRKSKATVGANAGVDVTVMVWRYMGVGISGRYARGQMTMPSADSGSIKIQVGGAQLSGGLRMRF